MATWEEKMRMWNKAATMTLPRQRSLLVLYEAKGGIGLQVTQRDTRINVVLTKDQWESLGSQIYGLNELPVTNEDKVKAVMAKAEEDLDQVKFYAKEKSDD